MKTTSISEAEAALDRVAKLLGSGGDNAAKALDVIRGISDDQTRSNALTAFISEAPDNLKPEALELAGKIGDERARSLALGSMAPHLPENLKRDALEAARGISNESMRGGVISDYAGSLWSNDLKRQALEMTRSIKDESTRAQTLVNLASPMPAQDQLGVLNDLKGIKDEGSRAEALRQVAPYLREPALVEKAFAQAHDLKDPSARAQAFIGLAPHLEDGGKQLAVSKTLGFLHRVQDENKRSEYLRDLGPHLGDGGGLQREALETALQLGDPAARATALSGLAPHLSDRGHVHDLKSRAVEAALATTFNLRHDSQRAKVLDELAPHVPPNQQSEALKAARRIPDSLMRVHALGEMVTHFSGEPQRDAQAAAESTVRSIDKENERAVALTGLAGRVPQMKDAALKIASTIKDDTIRNAALGSIEASEMSAGSQSQQNENNAAMIGTAPQTSDAPRWEPSKSDIAKKGPPPAPPLARVVAQRLDTLRSEVSKKGPLPTPQQPAKAVNVEPKPLEQRFGTKRALPVRPRQPKPAEGQPKPLETQFATKRALPVPPVNGSKGEALDQYSRFPSAKGTPEGESQQAKPFETKPATNRALPVPRVNSGKSEALGQYSGLQLAKSTPDGKSQIMPVTQPKPFDAQPKPVQTQFATERALPVPPVNGGKSDAIGKYSGLQLAKGTPEAKPQIVPPAPTPGRKR